MTDIVLSDGPVRVNSWNEWDPLRRVLVGRAAGTMVPAPEPVLVRDWPADGFPRGTFGPLPEDMVAAADAQLDGLCDILRARGVRVDRPGPFDFSQAVRTPDWEQGSMFGSMPPRDVLLTVGREIVEATMSLRSRWFEYLCYRPLLGAYYQADPAMRWEAAPKPRLTDASYRPGFWDEYATLSEAQQIERVRRTELVLTEAEPLFDAADVARCGKDLFVQLSLATNRAGARWLRQHFPDHRVHPITFANTHPQHIDATWVPLRPGLVLHCGERQAEQELLMHYAANHWQVVHAAAPMRTRQDPAPADLLQPVAVDERAEHRPEHRVRRGR